MCDKKNKMATNIEVFLNSATYIGIVSNINTLMFTNFHKLISCVSRKVTINIIYNFEQ